MNTAIAAEIVLEVRKMRMDRHETMSESKEIDEHEIENKESSYKNSREIKNISYGFFHSMSERYWAKKPVDEGNTPKRIFQREIEDMDINFDDAPQVYKEDEDLNFTKEELQQILEDDAGYIKEEVFDYDNEQKSDKNVYKETGLHNGAIRWGDYATKEGVEYITLSAGKYLRYGDENGSFMADIGVNYDSLELPIVEEKNPSSTYEVVKPFPVEVSHVARQPWNINEKTKDKDETVEATIQYKTPIPIAELLKEGYLKKI